MSAPVPDSGLRIEYHARVREVMGRDHDEIPPPVGVETVAELIDHLRSQSDTAAKALEGTIHCALDDAIAKPGDPIAGAAVISLFPPMTGG